MASRGRTIWTGDNLDILCGFNSNRNYAAPVGNDAGAAFEDTRKLSHLDVADCRRTASHLPSATDGGARPRQRHVVLPPRSSSPEFTAFT